MSSQEFNKTMEYIIQAMREKGYDPYQQLRGYLLENEPGYITRYKDARTLIQTLDKEQVEQYLAQYEKEKRPCDPWKVPDAQIHTLLGKLKLTKSEKVIDNLLGFFTDAPFGTPELINSFKNMDKEFYLVEKDGKQFLVTITDEFIETRKLAKRITAEKFEIGDWKFIKCAYEVKE